MPWEYVLGGDSFIHRLDPRVRLLAALAFSIVLALSKGFAAPCAALGACGVLVVAAGLPFSTLLRKLSEINLFMILLVVVLPFSTPGTTLFSIGTLSFSREGTAQALLMGVKGNAVLSICLILLTTMDAVRLGFALSRLRLPDKLTYLFFFTVRYLEVLHHEYSRLTTAMKSRCFNPGMNMHTYRTLACLIAILLIRSFDRSNRILAAMKCRGFNGHFYLHQNLYLSRLDAAFSLLSAPALVMFIWIGWF